MAYVRVYVWMPRGAAPFFDAGHGAAEIYTPERRTYYVTLLNRESAGVPGLCTSSNGEASRRSGFVQIRDRYGDIVPNIEAHGTENALNFQKDCKLTGGPPHFRFDVPVATGPGGHLFGVSVRRMERFWQRILHSPPGHPTRRYAALGTRNNCFGAVVGALLAGGLDLYAKPANNFVYQDGRTLIAWVEKAIPRINAMNDQRVLATRELYLDGMPMQRRSALPVPTLEEWKKDSDEGIAFCARRKEQVALIDTFLRLYHRAVGEGDRPAQLSALLVIMWNICSHLAEKPNSDRREAVLRLFGRVETALEELLQEREQAPVDPDLGRQPDHSSAGEGIWSLDG